MGLIHSLLCSLSLCVERIMTWSFCALLLMLLMLSNVLLIIYGISVGYHYAQKEITDYAMFMRITTTQKPAKTSGSDIPELTTSEIHGNNTFLEDLFQKKNNSEDDIFIKISDAPFVNLNESRKFIDLESNEHEKELMRKLFQSLRLRGNNATTNHMDSNYRDQISGGKQK